MQFDVDSATHRVALATLAQSTVPCRLHSADRSLPTAQPCGPRSPTYHAVGFFSSAAGKWRRSPDTVTVGLG